MNNYYQKYLKYKQKYLDLKNGGGNNTFVTLNYHNLYESKNKEYYQNIFSIFKNKILDKDYNICSSKISEYYRNKSLYNLKDVLISKKENKTINYHLLLKKSSVDIEDVNIDLLAFAIVDLVGSEQDEYYIDLICSKRGYGSIIMQYCINQAKKLYKEYITLDSINDNDTFEFYKRMGFHLDLPTYFIKINIKQNEQVKDDIRLNNKKYKECIEIIKPYLLEINNLKYAKDVFPINYEIRIQTKEEEINIDKLIKTNEINVELKKQAAKDLKFELEIKETDNEANYTDEELKRFAVEGLDRIKAKYPVMSLIPMIKHIDNIPLNISYPEQKEITLIRFEGLSESELLDESIKIKS
jgi:hypothetical protein